MIFTGYYALAFWWVLFFSTHSILASNKIKVILYKLGKHYRSYYRAVYNIISLTLLLPVIYTYLSTSNIWIFIPNTYSTLGGTILIGSGIYVIIDSFKNYDTAEFIGTYQIKTKKEYRPTSFSKNGWNNVVRHPLYFGSIILIVGLFIAIPNQKMALSSTLGLLYLIIGTYLEEKKLLKEFGHEYLEYQRQVSMFLPIKYLSKRIRK